MGYYTNKNNNCIKLRFFMIDFLQNKLISAMKNNNILAFIIRKLKKTV